MKDIKDKILEIYYEESTNDTECLNKIEKFILDLFRIKWVSVNDRLPVHAQFEAQQVIINSHVKGAKVEDVVICAVFYEGKFYPAESWSEEGTEGDTIKTVSHWMPLPEPPKN